MTGVLLIRDNQSKQQGERSCKDSGRHGCLQVKEKYIRYSCPADTSVPDFQNQELLEKSISIVLDSWVLMYLQVSGAVIYHPGLSRMGPCFSHLFKPVTRCVVPTQRESCFQVRHLWSGFQSEGQDQKGKAPYRKGLPGVRLGMEGKTEWMETFP